MEASRVCQADKHDKERESFSVLHEIGLQERTRRSTSLPGCPRLVGVLQWDGLQAASCKVTKHEKAWIENQHVFIPSRSIPLVSLHARRWSSSTEFNESCIVML
ncbi:hypothetical protein Tco_0977669 [Tanacetum coccineum]|uniref:Uncharacterized protein n=1 Tax=Tanacetum coccineum TaxID=301880 RepID=A0ABQ5EKZ5_9ASTR